MPPILSSLRHKWNAFMDRDSPLSYEYKDTGPLTTVRPDRPRFTRGNERSIVTAVYNKMAMDCASIEIEHVRLDDSKHFLEVINSPLNDCLTFEANIDQTARAFKQDIFMSMFDEGVVAIVPIDTDVNPTKTGSYDIHSMRTGKIIGWYPEYVRIRLYNDKTGIHEEVTLPKKMVAIVENPLYAVMNEPNSIMQRLIRKLNLLDAIDEQNGSGKLNLILQLPYIVKTESRKKQAEQRRKDMEEQLANSKYGVAYTDGTERITQLGRPIENNLMTQIEYLTSMLYSQLGITKEVLEGTADEEQMLNYNYRSIEPLVSAVVDELKRKFLTKTARSQNQSILFFRDHFKLIPISKLAEIADKFTRNEIASTNEFRQIVGFHPVLDSAANELRNKNMPIEEGQTFPNTETTLDDLESDTDYSEDFNQIDSQIDELERMIQ